MIAPKGRNPNDMPQSLSKVYVHITFGTKHRQKLIDDSIENALFNYLGGICKRLGCSPVRIGGYQNHVHILCLLSRKISVMDLLEELKKSSSKWMKQQGDSYSDFYWQGGYGIFSVSASEVDRVIHYIDNQEVNHRRRSFQG